MVYATLLAGFALLIIGGDILVRGSVSLAKLFNIPTIIVGLTIIAFGTSAPELMVSIKAALDGAPGIAIGNVVGSNIANILLVLGLPALIAVTDCRQPFVKENMFFLVGISILMVAMGFTGAMTHLYGMVLVLILIVFLWMQYKRGTSSKNSEEIVGEAAEMMEGGSWLPSGGFQIGLAILVGLIALPIGAHLTIDAATNIAESYGVSKALIALTVIALGTSLPELAAVIPAAMRGEAGLALGNVIGSNIFNILAVLGITSTIAVIPVEERFMQVDFWVMLAATAVLFIVIFVFKKINFMIGLVLVASYVAYIWFSFVPPKIPVKMKADLTQTQQFAAQ